MTIQRVRPTLKRQKELEKQVKDLEEKLDAADSDADGYEKRIQELEAGAGGVSHETLEEVETNLKDANSLLANASDRIQVLEGQLEDALAGRDHTQGADLPPIPEGRERFFVDLGGVHAEYLKRAAAREQRTPSNMLERILRIDRSRSPDKAGQANQLGSSLPADQAPQIPIT